MSKVISVPFDLEDYGLYELVEHYVESRKGFADNEVDYLKELIYSLEFLKTHYEGKEA
jgi:hypothetical protein|tara:strand:+ start:180 stop:353 length:174 start_codon:yes stop_codon:yes gene_type:complete